MSTRPMQLSFRLNIVVISALVVCLGACVYAGYDLAADLVDGDFTGVGRVGVNDLAASIRDHFDLFAHQRDDTKVRALKLSPVIMLPGYGGSRLEGKWTKQHVEHYFCHSQSDWTDIWVNVKLLLPYMIDCLIENLRLEFDPLTNTTKNTDGVEIRVKDRKSVTSVEYLNNMRLSTLSYFAPLIRKLSLSLGYKRELSMNGAPYDFRKAPNELDEYFADLKETSEQTFLRNDGEPITYICHSMGCNNILYFLQRQPQDWKDKHVKRIISLTAPWGGSVSALRAAAIGDNLGMPYLFDETKLNIVQRSLPSTMYLFPHKRVFSNEPLIRTNVGLNSSQLQTFTSDNFEQIFRALKHPDGYQMWQQTKDLLGSLEAPGVEIHCIVGRGQKTLTRLDYTGAFPHSSLIEYSEDGDGTVPLKSASFCQEWENQQSQPVHMKEFEVSHVSVLKDAQVLNYIKEILEKEAKSKTDDMEG